MEVQLTAKEMFEKLGYEFFENKSRVTYQKYDTQCKMIEFSKVEKKILIADDNAILYKLNIEELKAINKQIEELGWGNE